MLEYYLVLFFICTLLITPMTFAPLSLMDGYILPQIGVGAVGISLSLVFLFCIGFFPINITALLVFSYFIYLLLSTSWSTVQHNSLRDIPLIFLSLIGYLVTLTIFDNSNYLVASVLVIFSVSTFIALYSIGQRFRFDPLFPERLKPRKDYFSGKDASMIHEAFNNKKFVDSRAIGTIGNTNFAAGFFCSVIPFHIFLIFELNTLFIFSLLIILFAIYCTKSRAGLIAVGFGGLFFVAALSCKGLLFIWWLDTFTKFPALLNFILYLLAVSICSYLWIWAKKQTPLKDEFGKINSFLEFIRAMSDDSSKLNTMLDIEETHQDHPISHLRFRFRYWKVAWELWKKKPLQGYGLRTYRKEVYYTQALLNSKDNGKFLGYGYQTPQPRECHNDFIENFVEGGITGGMLFLAIVLTVFYNFTTFISAADTYTYIFGSALLAGVITLLINAFFFFPLRLASSALMFYVSLAMLESMSGSAKFIYLDTNVILIIILILSLSAMIWEGVIKPNLGNYYFTRYQFLNRVENRETALMKAINYCPKETIFRTHALIAYLEAFPDESRQHAEAMRQHYDGMTPACAMLLNCSIVEVARKNWDLAYKFLEQSLFHYPKFEQSRELLTKIYPLAPLQRRRIIMKRISEEGSAIINSIKSEIGKVQSEIGRMQMNIQMFEERMLNSILSEKVKMNIPFDWPYDVENGIFLSPKEVNSEIHIINMAGPNKIPLVLDRRKVPVDMLHKLKEAGQIVN